MNFKKAMADWRPIISAREYQPFRWVLEDAFDRAYALIDIVK